MKQRLIIIFFAALCLWSCRSKRQNTNEPPGNNSISALLEKAENDSSDTNQRLAAALAADTIAAKTNDLPGQLKSEKLIAGFYLKLRKPQLAKKYFFRTASLAEKLSDTKNVGIAFNNIGTVFNNQSEYDSALFYYNKANEIFRNSGNRLQLAQGLVNVGIVYKVQYNFDSAFSITLEAARILDSLKEKKDLASVYSTLGNILKELNRLDDAIHFLNLALDIRTADNDSARIASSLNNIGNIYKIKKDYTKALDYYNRSLAIKQNLKLTKATGTTLSNIAEIHFWLKNYERSEDYYNQALAVEAHESDKEALLSTSNKLTRLYLAENRIVAAKELAVKTLGLMPEIGLLKQRSDNALMLSEIYTQLRQHEKATKFAAVALALRDSLFTDNMAETVSMLNVKYKTAQREKELLLSKQLQSAQSSRIRLQSYFIALLAVITVLLLLIIRIVYRTSKFRKAAKQKVDTLMAELNHRVKNNMQILSDVLNLQLHSTTDEEQVSIIQSIRNRVQSITILHSLLYKDEYSGTIDMKNFIQSIVTNLDHAFDTKSGAFVTTVNIGPLQLNTKQAIPLGLILNELMTNIYKHSLPATSEPTLEIKLTEDGSFCRLSLADNCDYRDLKQPAKTKKGFGLMLVETLVQQLNGRHEVAANNLGTTHLIEFKKEL